MANILITIGNVSLACLIVFSSCRQSPGTDKYGDALEASGTNRAELERVLSYYSKEGDKQKVEAARFLIENMQGLETQSFDLFTREGGSSDYPLYTHPGLTGKNYMQVLDSLRLDIKPRTEADLETVAADYLIRNIDLAFQAWRGNSWSKNYTEELFREYILPHRVDTEDLSDWRSFFIERYTPMIDTMSYPKTVRNVAALITRDLRGWFDFSYDALLLKPALTPQEAMAHHLGECNNISDMFVLALRAMGIAAAKDVIPVWGNSYGGHVEAMYFDEQGNPVLVATGNPLGASPVRVYRVRYSELPQPADRLTDNRRYEDVTAQYAALSDISIQIDPVSIPVDTTTFLALAAYNDGNWKPVVSATGIRRNIGAKRDAITLYEFKGISRGIVYRPVWADTFGGMEPAGEPLCLDPRGNITSMAADTIHRLTMNLTYAATPAQQTMLVRPQDMDSFVPGEYLLLYWSNGKWVEHTRSITKIRDKTGQLAFVIQDVPSGTFYRLVNRKTGKNFRNRPFTLWGDRFERY